jgi:hypothetical protein
MRSNTWTLSASALFFALSLGLAWRAWRQESALGPSLRALAQKQAALDEQTRRAEEDADAGRRSRAEARARIQSPNPPKSQAADGPADDALKRMSLQSLLASDPKLLGLYLKSYRLGLNGQFRAAFKSLGLTPAQIAKLEDIATAAEADTIDIRASAEAQGLSTSDPGITAMMQESKQDFRNAVASVIGINWQLLQASSVGRIQPLQSAVDQVAAQVAFDAQPLTSDQAAELTQILANNSSAYKSGGRATPNSVDWAAAEAQAAGTLTPAEVRAMTSMSDLGALSSLVKQFYATRGPQEGQGTGAP